MATTIGTARAAKPTLMRAFSLADNVLGDARFELGPGVGIDVWLVGGEVALVPNAVELELAVIAPSTTASTISWPVPQHAVLCPTTPRRRGRCAITRCDFRIPSLHLGFVSILSCSKQKLVYAPLVISSSPSSPSLKMVGSSTHRGRDADSRQAILAAPLNFAA
jgi:hypothetical protein